MIRDDAWSNPCSISQKSDECLCWIFVTGVVQACVESMSQGIELLRIFLKLMEQFKKLSKQWSLDYQRETNSVYWLTWLNRILNHCDDAITSLNASKHGARLVMSHSVYLWRWWRKISAWDRFWETNFAFCWQSQLYDVCHARYVVS